jgi:hypothetical protein
MSPDRGHARTRLDREDGAVSGFHDAFVAAVVVRGNESSRC